MSDEDFYKILGLKFDATPEDVRSAYRRLARAYHPDVAPTEKDREHFQKVTEAYSTLSDLSKRNSYNKGHGFPFVDFLDDDAESAAAAAAEAEAEPAEERGKISSALSNSKEIWRKLRAGKDGSDARVTDKVAQMDPSSVAADPDDPPIAAWGEFDDQGARPQSGKSVLSWLRRGKSERNIEELKKYQDSILRANNVAPVDGTSWQKDESRKWRAPEESKAAESAVGPEERVFQFRVTSYESFLGTRRQVAFPSKGSENFTRLNVKIPAGIKDGTRMQISRGWDRISIKVEVVDDKFYRVSGSDIWVFVPVVFNEAVFGVDLHVLGPDASVRCSVPGRERFLAQQQLAERGLPRDGGKGDIFVQPYVVPSTCSDEAKAELLALSGPEIRQQAEKARQGQPLQCGQTGVHVVTVTPEELFGAQRVSFSSDKPDSFQIPNGWTGGILKSTNGAEVIPFLLLPAEKNEAVEMVARRVREQALATSRDEMVS